MLDSMTDSRAEAHIDEKPWLTNPFNSVHAVALTNLGEFTSGILVTTQIDYMNRTSPYVYRGIVLKLGSTYHKKARGRIHGVCDFQGLATTVGEHRFVVSFCVGWMLGRKRRGLIFLTRSVSQVKTELYDAANVNVATTEAEWILTITPKKNSSKKD